MKTEPFGSILAYPSSPRPVFHRALTGSFSYMRNSVCKDTRNSTEFRGIPGNLPRNSAEFRGIPYVFQKIPYSVGSQKRTFVDTLDGTRQKVILGMA